MIYPYFFIRNRSSPSKNGKNAYKSEKKSKLYAQNLSKPEIFKEICMTIRIKPRKQPVLSVKRENFRSKTPQNQKTMHIKTQF